MITDVKDGTREMNSDSIITAQSPNDIFGSTLGSEELLEHAMALTNLLSANDPNYGEAVKKIEDFRKQLDYPIAKIDKGFLKTRKSPYQVISPRRELTDNIVVHNTLNKKNVPLLLSFASRPQLNSLISRGNNHIETIRASVTKRNRIAFPEIIDTVYIDTGKAQILATVHDIQEGQTFNLIPAEENISDDTIISLYRTMLDVLQKTHNAGIIHGACYMNAWVWNKDTNILVLKDWQYSVKEGEPLTVRSQEALQSNVYLERTVSQGKVDKATDIRLASYAIHALTNESNSPWLRKFIKGMADFTSETTKSALKELNECIRDNTETV